MMMGKRKSTPTAKTRKKNPSRAAEDQGRPLQTPGFRAAGAIHRQSLPDEGEHFLQSTMVLRVADAHVGDSLKLYMPELKHRIIMLLSSKKPSTLATVEG